MATKEMHDFAERNGLSVSTYEYSGRRDEDDRIITSWELVHAGAMPEGWHCVECHAEEIFGMRIPQGDPAIGELWNGIHDIEDDRTTLSEIYLVDGYSGWFCCGAREYVRRMATVELREVVAEVLEWRVSEWRVSEWRVSEWRSA